MTASSHTDISRILELARLVRLVRRHTAEFATMGFAEKSATTPRTDPPRKQFKPHSRIADLH